MCALLPGRACWLHDRAEETAMANTMTTPERMGNEYGSTYAPHRPRHRQAFQGLAWLAVAATALCGAWLVVTAVRRKQEGAAEATDIDEMSTESFPASDPPARTVVTGATARRRF